MNCFSKAFPNSKNFISFALRSASPKTLAKDLISPTFEYAANILSAILAWFSVVYPSAYSVFHKS